MLLRCPDEEYKGIKQRKQSFTNLARSVDSEIQKSQHAPKMMIVARQNSDQKPDESKRKGTKKTLDDAMAMLEERKHAAAEENKQAAAADGQALIERVSPR